MAKSRNGKKSNPKAPRNGKKSDPKPAQTGEDSAPEEVIQSLDIESRKGRRIAKKAIHALLFASDRPLSANRIAETLGDVDPAIVHNLLSKLADEINESEAPYKLREIAGGYQLTTDAEYAPYIRKLLNIKRSNKLSKVVLETLAIIAYRQPVTRPDVEAIRGVSVSHAFNQLQERRLIKPVGVANVPGRPRLYKTTDEFLIHFGIKSLKEMPSIEELREMA